MEEGVGLTVGRGAQESCASRLASTPERCRCCWRGRRQLLLFWWLFGELEGSRPVAGTLQLSPDSCPEKEQPPPPLA